MVDTRRAYIARAFCNCAVAGSLEGPWNEEFIAEMSRAGYYIELVPLNDATFLLSRPCPHTYYQ